MYREKFKNDLSEKLEQKGLSNSSIKNYIRNLEMLNNGEPLKNFRFLADIDGILSKLEDYKDNTRRGYLVSIVSALGTSTKKTDKAIRNKYYEHMNNASKEIREKPSNVKSETQAENWITWEDVKKEYDALDEKAKDIMKLKKLTENQYITLLYRTLLALYIFNPSRRNQDYLKMVIVNKHTDDMPTDKNYLSLANNEFIFNVYKTAKKYGQQKIKFNDELKRVIMDYLKFHPCYDKRKNEPCPFLVYYDGHPFAQVNSITRALNDIFHPKKIGASMLRHIYLSSRYAPLLKQQQEDAEKMGHSLEMQREYIKTEEPENIER